jgi:hypothetical protein
MARLIRCDWCDAFSTERTSEFGEVEIRDCGMRARYELCAACTVAAENALADLAETRRSAGVKGMKAAKPSSDGGLTPAEWQRMPEERRERNAGLAPSTT